MLIRFRDGGGYPSPFNMFDDFFNRDLTSFFGRDVNEMLQRNQGIAMPAVNIRETENNFQIELAAPGLRKEDFRINLEHTMLTISAQQETRTEEGPSGQSQPQAGQGTANNDITTGPSAGGEQPQGMGQQGETSGQATAQGQPSNAMQTQGARQPARYTRREFSYSSFTRSFSLPETVNAENISASYQDGILTVTVPKRNQQQTRLSRNIDIS